MIFGRYARYRGWRSIWKRRERSRTIRFIKSLSRTFIVCATRRHSKFPLMRSQTVGVAVCRLPRDFADEYFMRIEAAARRNVKKARRLGYEFRRIEYNDHLTDVREIRRSANERQGALPDEFVNGEVTPSEQPTVP